MGLTLRNTARRISRLKGVCVFIPPSYEQTAYRSQTTGLLLLSKNNGQEGSHRRWSPKGVLTRLHANDSHCFSPLFSVEFVHAHATEVYDHSVNGGDAWLWEPC